MMLNCFEIDFKQGKNKITKAMEIVKKGSKNETEAQVHALFEDYLVTDIAALKGKDTSQRAKDIDLKNADKKKTDQFNELMQVYCEEELKYRIKAMEKAYATFTEIYSLVKDDLNMKGSIREDRKGPKR